MTSKEVLDDIRQDELLQAVKSLISDIESMQTKPWNSYAEPEGWFGPFSNSNTDWEEGDTQIEWPNLAISLAAVKKLLEPQTIEGELTPAMLTNTICAICREPQFSTPSGLVCKNGHGGANSL